MIDLRHGPYRDALADATWDALICDPPYSERTHTGHNDGTSTADRLRDALARMEAKRAAGDVSAKLAFRITRQRGDVARAGREQTTQRRPLSYAAWTPDDVRQFVTWAAERTRGWMVCMCDTDLAPVYAEAMEAAGRYVFAPLVWYAPGSSVRMTGDGPACWVCWIVVSRPRSQPYSKWGSLPGGYAGSQDHGRNGGMAHVGGKPLWLMRDRVRDYSRPGAVVCDPCAGWGTTLIAAAIEGRHGLGAEMDAETHATALARYQSPQVQQEIAAAEWLRGMDAGAGQASLLGGDE